MSPRLAGNVFTLGILIVALGAIVLSAGIPQLSTRQFEFTYKVQVPGLAAGGAALQLWVPLPASNAYQDISDLRIESPVAYKVERDQEYGNRFAYFRADSEKTAAGFDVMLRFKVTRREHRVALDGSRPAARVEKASAKELDRDLKADHLVPLNGVIADLAREHTQGAKDPLDKAHRIYEYVVATMKYDKSGEGWGHGDAMWACAAKRGNCPDFHALFIGMARASGIPARFEIGFPLPDNKTEGEIPGYHCWAEFYLKGIGWVPVDASEAWKHPEKHSYFFGAHDDNRVQFTTGRDIRLDPAQKGQPLNYFVYPYAELNGQPFNQLKTQFSFRDLRPAPAAGNGGAR